MHLPSETPHPCCTEHFPVTDAGLCHLRTCHFYVKCTLAKGTFNDTGYWKGPAPIPS